ncbi:MAG: hypothetical protein MUF15_22550 [Acidobacteria bacterium]|jgi:hypothetical protein|nr:hypothetical protein [Acidobacteriota bacterium]
MYKNEVFLKKENFLFAFDRRDNKLFRIINGERLEIKDIDYIGNIVISKAEVVSPERAMFAMGK